MLAMTMIIVCHILQTYGNELCYWFNSGVQIFLIISGFLYGGKVYDKPLAILKKQFKKILTPYYLFLIIIIPIYLIWAPQEISITSILTSLLCCGTISGQGHFWFIPYILFCYLITPYLYYIKESLKEKSLKHTLLIYALILILIPVIGQAFDSYFGAANISCYVIGYFLYDLTTRFKDENVWTWVIVLAAILTIGANAVQIYIDYISGIALEGTLLTIYGIFKGYAHLLLGLLIFVTVYRLCKGIRYSKLLRFSDTYSYEIFIVHATFIRSVFHLLNLTSINVINIILAVALTILTGVLLKRLSETFTSFKFKVCNG